MSKKSLFDQPGIEQLVPGSELPVGVKVTGRNMHAISLLVSVAGETTGVSTAVTADFREDGSLESVVFGTRGGPLHTANAGEYVVLGEDRKTLLIADQENYEFGKTFLPLAVSFEKAIAGLNDSILGPIAKTLESFLGLDSK
jgi:hypothetical protein